MAPPAAHLERGREHFAQREWDDAYLCLAEADSAQPLPPDDLYRLAWAAGLTARDEEMLATLERVYQARLEVGEPLAAARAAFWLGFRVLARGELGRANGWLNRAQRLIENHDCVEQGYLLLPQAHADLFAGRAAQGQEAAARATRIGERFKDPDLMAFGRNLQGRALLAQGQFAAGLALLDEAMVAVSSGDLSEVVVGILYCSAIGSCQRIYAIDRAREWTQALNAWCARQPQLAMFAGQCLVHRAELLQLSGAWAEAVEEAGRAVKRCVRHKMDREAAGQAHYQCAEIHRLRGEFAAADAAYREASRCGLEPQPGLALLRLAQGERDAAAAAIRRVLAATTGPLPRTRFLPAYVEIMLASGERDAAREASRELQEIAAAWQADVLDAIAAHAQASVSLALGDPKAAVAPARRAFEIWHKLGAPFLAARLRVLMARVCSALGDADGALLELEGAREAFEELGAQPDLAGIEALSSSSRGGGGLTARELQVLRLIAEGKTNKVIARELSLSGKTVDRHVSNLFAKVGVSSRASATAFAYEHKLV